jgi:DNA-binding XRE family transcriptional regulator
MARQLINAGGEQFVLVPLAEYERLAKLARELAGDLPEPVAAVDLDAEPPVPKDGESRLRAWRKHRGMTLDVLGEMVGAHKMSLSEMERGLVVGKVSVWAKLAQALRTDIESILPEDA